MFNVIYINRQVHRSLVWVICLLFCMTISSLIAQEEDLLDFLEDLEDEEMTFVEATFKANRIINLHSIENTAKGVLDVKVSHRFGTLNGGFFDLFGLDQASIRIGGDYGITDQLMVGLGRSSFEKTFDVFFKYKWLRQSTGQKIMPLSAAFMASTAIQTLKWQQQDRKNYFTSRLFYTMQLLFASKINEQLSLQLSPTLVHRNLVATSPEEHDVLAIGAGGRVKLNKRLTLNVEYIFVLPNQLAPNLTNSFSVGFDIETGGHVFQLHLTNSISMIEKGFITQNNGTWAAGDIHFGFNISRVFTLSSHR